MLDIYIKGFLLGGSLIMAIGLQNAFVLRQGLKNSHVFATALAAALCDFILIAAGVLGFGILVTKAPALLDILKYGGAAFLFVYGALSFKKALKTESLDQGKAEGLLKEEGLKETISLLIAFSLLNPHVYLDTVVLIGGLSGAQGATGKYWFGGGAATASFVWFFALAYAGRWMAPLFKKPRVWQILDIIIGIVMWGIAFSLLASP